ncbi:MAG TPA: hypothetical protein VFQ43_03225 [Nitrososphaera sp.]|nr:hypothetical protein [Nitrososphaera sp.]
MATSKIIDRGLDPISVEGGYVTDRMILRIGQPKPGKSRTAFLNVSEARMLGHYLLYRAERVEAAERQKKDAH